MSRPGLGAIRSIRFIRYIRIPLSVDASRARWTRRPEEPSQQLHDPRSPIPDSRFPIYWSLPKSKLPFVIVTVPVPVTAPSVPVNVPLMRVGVKLVMITEPLLPAADEWCSDVT